MPTLSALNSTKSSALIDTNNDGNLAEITNPALKAALATNENSGWNFNTDSVSAAAFNSLMVKATKAADTSPTIKNAADKVAVAGVGGEDKEGNARRPEDAVRDNVGEVAGARPPGVLEAWVFQIFVFVQLNTDQMR